MKKVIFLLSIVMFLFKTSATANYDKKFYDGDSADSGKTIFFKISFLPFGEINTPTFND